MTYKSVEFEVNRPNHFEFFKGSLPQILLGSFLNTLTHLYHQFVNLMHETPPHYKSEFLVQKLNKPSLRALILGEESLDK